MIVDNDLRSTRWKWATALNFDCFLGWMFAELEVDEEVDCWSAAVELATRLQSLMLHKIDCLPD